MTKILIALLVLFIILFILLSIMAFKAKSSLMRLSDSVFKVANGDLTSKLSTSKRLFFSTLFKGVNEVIITIRSLLAKTTTMNDKVIQYCQELESNINYIEESSRETSLAINEVSSDMMTQMNEVILAKELMDEFVDDYNKVVSKGNDIESIATDMIDSINNSKQSYSALLDKVKKSADSGLALKNKFESLESSATQIQGIADTVTSLSETTNLLSLNASIEAARVGEHGRGFAVVADEIRKLAEMSSLQAKEIQDIINKIKIEISDVSSSMEEDTKNITEYLEFSKVTNEGMSKLSLSSMNTLESITDINHIINTQTSKIKNIDDIVKNISSISSNTTAATEEISASSQEQIETLTNISSSVSDLVNMTKEIKISISSFAKEFKVDSDTQKYINDSLEDMQKMARNTDLSCMEYSKCTSILKNYIEKYPNFDLFALMDSSGLRKAITLAYKEKEVYINFIHRPYFKAAISGKNYISEPYISVDTSNYCLALAVPVKDSSGSIVGIFMGDLRLS